MHKFSCSCGNTVYFDNTRCLACGRMLGYLPERRILAALEPASETTWRPAGGGTAAPEYRACQNYSQEDVCNWMVPVVDSDPFCRACRLNKVIPDLSVPRNRVFWARVERAKRRLLYTLDGLGLPVSSRSEDPDHGMAFEFLADVIDDAAGSDHLAEQKRVLTGHNAGVITINIREADPGAREEMRERLGEPYRTLLGHFRHESGHFFWQRLVRDTGWLAQFRSQFGDERADYDKALSGHYRDGPPADWPERYISAYASAHPWEDFAETWAHYLHMVDTLETAHDFGFVLGGEPVRPLATGGQLAQGAWHTLPSFDNLCSDWVRLTLALNALNRSMGLRDAYPFVLSAAATDKLRFVHRVVSDVAG